MVEELECAKKCLIKIEQQSEFRTEIDVSYKRNKAIPNNNSLKHLNPLLDKDNLLYALEAD